MTKRKTPNYLLIGFFMAIGILSVLISVVFADKLVNKFKGGYPIYIKFNHLDGVVPGSKIVVGSGKTIGQVDAIELEGSILVVTAFINNKYKINKDASFQIFSTSFVGGKYIAVENYTGLAPYIQKKDVLDGVNPVTINSILGMFSDAFTSGTEEGMITGISGIISSLNSTISTAELLLKKNDPNITLAIEELTQTAKHLNSISANVDRKLSKISDKEFQSTFNDIQRSLKNLDLFLNDINSPNAPLSILKDPNITHSIRTIVTNLEETTERVKAKPSLLLRS